MKHDVEATYTNIEKQPSVDNGGLDTAATADGGQPLGLDTVHHDNNTTSP